MAITDLPLFSMLRTRMNWHQERQRLLSENVSNADTPNFRPKDIDPPQFDNRRFAVAPIALARTEGTHIAAAMSDASRFQLARQSYDVRPGWRPRGLRSKNSSGVLMSGRKAARKSTMTLSAMA